MVHSCKKQKKICINNTVALLFGYHDMLTAVRLILKIKIVFLKNRLIRYSNRIFSKTSSYGDSFAIGFSLCIVGFLLVISSAILDYKAEKYDK